MKKYLIAGLTLAFATPVMAQTVSENANNGSLATAQDLNGTFGLTANADIQNSTTIPHVTVLGGPSEQQFDYYTFTVATAGTQGLFDIDFGQGDLFLDLLTMGGTQLAYSDDAGLDTGSANVLDPFINHIFGAAGTYAIRVGSCCAFDGNNDLTGFASNNPYQLHVSLQAPGLTGAVPEPSTWAMMLFGFGAIGTSMRRRRKPSSTLIPA